MNINRLKKVLAAIPRRAIAWEKQPTMDPRSTELLRPLVERASLEAAAAQISKLIWTYKKCQDENDWPGYAEDVEIDLPGYVLRRAMEPAL